MTYARLNNKAKRLELKLSMQRELLQENIQERRTVLARLSRGALLALGAGAGVLLWRVGPSRLFSIGLAVVRLWPRPRIGVSDSASP